MDSPLRDMKHEVMTQRINPHIFNEKVCIKKNGVNQKSSQVITIKITYGSGFQKTYGNEMLVTLLKTFNSYFSKSHKENSFSVTTKSV